MLGMSLFDIYVAATILGTGYVLLSAFLGNLHLGADTGSGHGVDLGQGDLDADAGADLGEADVGHDVGHEATQSTGGLVDATDEKRRAFGACSPTIIASFLAGFGAVGLVLQRGYAWDTLSLLPSGAGGLLLANILMRVFNKLAAVSSGSSHLRIRTLIGTRAEVTSAIGENAPGTISFVQQGVRYSRSARSANGRAIRRGQRVTIEALDGNDTFVLPED